MQKNVIASLALALITTVSFAQSNKYQSALTYLRNGDLEKAKTSIDAASIHEKTNTDPRVFKVRGDIYKTIAVTEDEQYASLKPGAIDVAIMSYDKALELEGNSKKISEGEIKQSYSELIPVISNGAVNAYNSGDYAKSSEMFEKQGNVSAKFGIVDTSAYYNAGITASQSGNNAKAIQMYQQILSTGYNGASLYYEVARLQIEENMTDEALSTIEEGKTKYPGDKNLLLLETNLYLQDESKMQQAIDNLNATIADDPTNASLFYARGTLYQKNPETTEQAEADFKKCIELDPEHFEANYNLGALYVNESSTVQTAMNELDFSEQKKYDELKAERDELFKMAIGPLEKALELRPEEKGVQATLLELYGKTGATEKYNAMKAKLGK